jgi:hypothetical protein
LKRAENEITSCSGWLGIMMCGFYVSLFFFFVVVVVVFVFCGTRIWTQGFTLQKHLSHTSNLFWRYDIANYLLGLTWNCDSPNLSPPIWATGTQHFFPLTLLGFELMVS